MTVTENPTDHITIKIDGKDVTVPKGTLIIRAAEQAGVYIPRFCDHPLLAPAAACRQCLVEVATPNREGVVSKMPKPQAACSMTVSPGMEVYTSATSQVTARAQHGVMEFLLINHPMDCPICDKGGECPLQNQAMIEGRTQSRFVDVKRTYPKPISISSQILLDRDRCILCQRCTRFSTQIAGDPFIQLHGRGGGTPGYGIHSLPGSQIGNFDASVLGFTDEQGAHSEAVANNYSGPQGMSGLVEGYSAGPVGVAESDVEGKPFVSYFSGNVIQICPVGALTSASYRFRARPFDLVSVDSVTEHDASGAAIRVDYRRGTVVRRMASHDMAVNEDWITDKDRFAFHWQNAADRLKYPQIKGIDEPISWSEALGIAAQGLKGKKVGVITGGRLPLEDAYAYSKFARVALGTNNIDFRTRAGSSEEDSFLALLAGHGLGVTYSDVEKAGHVLTVGLEAEDECGSLFLRLRKGVLAHTTSVSVVSAYATRGTAKMDARFIGCVPGDEAHFLNSVVESADGDAKAVYDDLRNAEGSVILVGERAGNIPGALTAAIQLASRTNSKIAWVPRRAGDRGAVEAGAMPNLLPGGRLVSDTVARADLETLWGTSSLPQEPGMNTEQMLHAAANGELDALILAGVELVDLPDVAQKALNKAFVVQLEIRETDTTAFADVLLPVAPPSEKGGTFINWEGRMRPFGQVLTSRSLPDRRVLDDLALELGFDLGLRTLEDVVNEYAQLRQWKGMEPAMHSVAAEPVSVPRAGSAILATWKQMIDLGALQSHAPHLAQTARKAVAVMSPATAEQTGISTKVKVTGPTGSIIVDAVTVPMPDGVVWLPQNSVGCQIAQIGSYAGDVVTISNSEVTK